LKDKVIHLSSFPFKNKHFQRASELKLKNYDKSLFFNALEKQEWYYSGISILEKSVVLNCLK